MIYAAHQNGFEQQIKDVCFLNSEYVDCKSLYVSYAKRPSSSAWFTEMRRYVLFISTAFLMQLWCLDLKLARCPCQMNAENVYSCCDTIFTAADFMLVKN